MGFLENCVSTTMKGSNALELAKKLANTVRSKRKQMADIHLEKWAVDFTSLEHKYGHDRVKVCLDWYCSVMCQPYVPLAFSASSFKSKYVKIENLMRRQAVAVDLPMEIKSLYGKLRRYHWPKGSDGQLPFCLQVSHDNYQSFYEKLKSFTVDDGDSFLLDYLKAKYLLSPIWFVEYWFIEVNKKVSDWDGWGGDLTSYIFTTDNQMFHNTASGWCYRFCGTSFRWHQIFRQISGE